LPFQPNGLPKKDMGLEKIPGFRKTQQWRQETESSPKPESPTLLKNQEPHSSIPAAAGGSS